MEQLNDLDYKATRLLITGAQGTGKTTLACRFIDLHPADLVLIYDWQGGEFAKRLGCPLVKSRADLGKQLETGRRIICYDPSLSYAEKKGEEFNWFCGMALEVARATPGQKLVVVDELQELVSAQDIPPNLVELCDTGRRARVDIVMLGQRANALGTSNRDQITHLAAFRNLDENALKFAKSLRLDPDGISTQDDCHCVYLDCRTGEKSEIALWGKKSNGLKEPQLNQPNEKE